MAIFDAYNTFATVFGLLGDAAVLILRIDKTGI